MRAGQGRESANRVRVVLEQKTRDDFQNRLLEQIAQSARVCERIETELRKHPAPELEMMIKLHRVFMLDLALKPDLSPEWLKLANALMKPALDWARLEEKRKDRELAEKKHRDQLEAAKETRQKELAGAAGGLTAETLRRIEQELNLL